MRLSRNPEYARRLASACVYFMAEEGSEYVKVGWCIDVTKRLEDVQLGNPRKVRLLGTVNGGRNIESDLHRRFSAYRVRGEWFRLCGELKDFVDSGLGKDT